MTTKPPHLSLAESEALQRRRRARNWAMLVVLVGVAALFYAIAMVKMAQHGHL